MYWAINPVRAWLIRRAHEDRRDIGPRCRVQLAAERWWPSRRSVRSLCVELRRPTSQRELERRSIELTHVRRQPRRRSVWTWITPTTRTVMCKTDGLQGKPATHYKVSMLKRHKLPIELEAKQGLKSNSRGDSLKVAVLFVDLMFQWCMPVIKSSRSKVNLPVIIGLIACYLGRRSAAS